MDPVAEITRDRRPAIRPDLTLRPRNASFHVMITKTPIHSLFRMRTAMTLGVACLCGASAHAKSLIYYSSTTSTVESVNPADGTAGPTIASNLFLGASPGAARNIQIDSNNHLLWYANSSGSIDSINLLTKAAGPKLSGGGFLGANSGADRHFCIDPARNLLYYSATDNSVQIISLNSKAQVGVIASSRFKGAAVGGFRHTTVDYVNNIMYYASTDNSIRSFSLFTFKEMGVIPSNKVKGAAAGAYRHIIYDPNTRLLYYKTASNTIESIHPGTLVAGPSVSSNKLKGAAVGASRPITLDAPILAVDAKGPSLVVKGDLKFTTDDASVKIRGQAADKNGVSVVRFKVNDGALKDVVGKETWVFTAKLRLGVNKIKVFALDLANNRSDIVTLTITRK